MGFTSGFVGGVTLTTGVLYLTMSIHRQNRTRQAALISQQSQVLTNIIQPQPPLPPPTARAVRGGLTEQAKDIWNGSIESFAKWVYDKDWNQVRSDVEDRMFGLASKVAEGAKNAGERVAAEAPAAVPSTLSKREG